MTAGAEALAAAIRDFDVAAAREMLVRSPELANSRVNRTDDGGETMLCYAITGRAGQDFAYVSDEQAAIVQALVDAGADLEAPRFPEAGTGEPGAMGMLPLGNAAWQAPAGRPADRRRCRRGRGGGAHRLGSQRGRRP